MIASLPAHEHGVENTKAKVLIIDDDYGPRESLRILLKYDYEVIVTSSVAEGVEALKANSVDTIILDNRMPGRTGLEGIVDLRKIDESVSIIMLTGYGTLETACEAFRNQATDFMTKPPDTDAMLEAVAKNVALARGKRARSVLSKELAELNRGLSAELAETRPLAKLGQRSDEIIHDMGNPLTILTCCVELLQGKVDEMRVEEGPQWVEALGYIQMIKKSIQHCCGLADAWRQLRDDISEDRELVGLRTFLDGSFETLLPMSSMMNVTLDVDFSAVSDVNGVEIDATQMRRVLYNLVVNAMQATPRNEGKVSVRATAGDDAATITVVDNGFGIPAEQLSIIFEPYFTTKKDGTGLGLAIAKRVVEEHSGSIGVESEVGVGTKFTLRLPLKAAVAA